VGVLRTPRPALRASAAAARAGLGLRELQRRRRRRRCVADSLDSRTRGQRTLPRAERLQAGLLPLLRPARHAHSLNVAEK